MGKIPFISSYATFSPGRNWEQIRTTICYNAQNVKIAGAHAGISVGPDGATHQMLEDIAITRALPTMTVVVPCDSIETRKATIAAGEIVGPVYLRFAREKTPVVTREDTPFMLGKAEIFRDGQDVAIIACGPVIYEALVAAEKLAKEGIDVRVINNHTIKPLDVKTLVSAARDTGAIVTVEEHQKTGGLGGAIAELLTSTYPVPIRRVAVDDRFGETGEPEELLKKFGLKAPDIVRAVREAIKMKTQGLCSPGQEQYASNPLLLRAVAPEHHFQLQTGEMIGSIPELKQAMEHMSKKTFRHHANMGKNDFATWIQDMYGDKLLARQLQRFRDPKKAALLLGFCLEQLEHGKKS